MTSTEVVFSVSLQKKTFGSLKLPRVTKCGIESALSAFIYIWQHKYFGSNHQQAFTFSDSISVHD